MAFLEPFFQKIVDKLLVRSPIRYKVILHNQKSPIFLSCFMCGSFDPDGYRDSG